MTPDYKDKVAIITGASSGIGYVTTQAFAQRGARVVAVARREALLQKLVSECQAAAPSSYLCGDLGQQQFAEHVIHDTITRHGRLDFLVNNAGIAMHQQIYDVTPDDVDHLMRVNFMSCVWTTLAAIPHMLAQGAGTIVNISSFAAHVSPPREAVYAASKAAMNSFSEGLWHDLAGSNIHVAVINPGPIDTEIWDNHDEASTYKGYKFPPALVADAIFDAIERRRFEVTIPRRNPQLVAARFLRLVLPSVLRKAMARAFPIPAEVIHDARTRPRHKP